MHKSKTVWCTWQQLFCYWGPSSSGLGQRMSYNWQARAIKQSPRRCTQEVLVLTLIWLLFTDMACIARPHPAYFFIHVQMIGRMNAPHYVIEGESGVKLNSVKLRALIPQL